MGIPLDNLLSLGGSSVASGYQAKISLPVKATLLSDNIHCLSNAFQEVPPLFYTMYHLLIYSQSLLKPDWSIALGVQMKIRETRASCPWPADLLIRMLNVFTEIILPLTSAVKVTNG